MFDAFDEAERQVFGRARLAARTWRRNAIGADLVLHGILSTPDAVAVAILESLGHARAHVLNLLEIRMDYGMQRPGAGPVPFTPRVKRALDATLVEAERLGHAKLHSGHVLLGLMSVDDERLNQVFDQIDLAWEPVHAAVAAGGQDQSAP